jgi:predicted nucleotidyltransferase
MPNGSSGSVRITWFDREKALAALRDAVRRLVDARPEIEEVILFGSLATGQSVPGSDADLLVILRSSEEPFPERIPRYIPSGCGIDVDVFPYTLEEIGKMQAGGNPLVKEALEHGLVLFRRGAGRPRKAGRET